MAETNETTGFKLTLQESLKTMRQNPSDILLWFVINVICGLLPILLLVFISYLLKLDPNSPLDPYKPIYEGDLFIFVTTLCAAAVGVYWEIKGEHFWNIRRVSLISIFLIVAFSSAIYLLLKIEKIRTVLPFDDNAVWWASIIFLTVSVGICVHMFAMRLSMNNIDEFAKDREEKTRALSEQAKQKNKTRDGAEL